MQQLTELIDKLGIADMTLNEWLRHLFETRCPAEEIWEFYRLAVLAPSVPSLGETEAAVIKDFMAAFEGPEREGLIAAFVEILKSQLETNH
jgi:hypothetical protein